MNDRLAALERNYRILQRRTILYGILMVAIGMYISVYLTTHLGLSALQGGALGGCVGALLVLTSWTIVRWRNPL